jgi:hypothetical protein
LAKTLLYNLLSETFSEPATTLLTLVAEAETKMVLMRVQQTWLQWELDLLLMETHLVLVCIAEPWVQMDSLSHKTKAQFLIHQRSVAETLEFFVRPEKS